MSICIALAGNPNSGKTSLFNLLTGSNQKVGNYPGISVERRTGAIQIATEEVRVLDLPGTYSLFPNSAEERVTCETLITDSSSPDDKIDFVLYVADVNHLDKQLLLFTQIRDLGYPMILMLSMIDEFDRVGHEIDLDLLRVEMEVPIYLINNRDSSSRNIVIEAIASLVQSQPPVSSPFYQIPKQHQVMTGHDDRSDSYRNWIRLHHADWLELPDEFRLELQKLRIENNFVPLRAQIEENLDRLSRIEPMVKKVMRKHVRGTSTSQKADDILTHSIWGPLIFVILMLLVFQAIFAWATYPMDLIESFFAMISTLIGDVLPAGWLSDLLTQGLIPGLAGVLIFVPQIAILFFLISILEEAGYMARAVYLFDHLLQKFGMNGRSIVALISGGACAIPAIMTTRTISNWRERLITILVTPFISCSARIPVYTLLIAFVIPYRPVAFFFNSQGLFFAGLYLLSIATALIAGWALKYSLPAGQQSMLALELPTYRRPSARAVWQTMKNQVLSFITEAGKIILIISLALWLLASYGPPKAMEVASQEVAEMVANGTLSETEGEVLTASRKLEASYAGHLGKAIEPIIAPLGYDWKMGIGLIAAFAAREVFVGTMATIYSVGGTEDEFRIREKLAEQRDIETGQPVFDRATALSLLLFFVFAMQCMSTLAVVKKETRSWKWPIIQFVVMTGLAYFVALVVYQILS